MRIANIIKNDVVNGIGVSVSLFVQGCNRACPGCFNPETWDFSGGYTSTSLKGDLIKALCANGIQRNLSILGGEPLHPHNRAGVWDIISSFKIAIPDLKIFLWTGYTLEELLQEDDDNIRNILSHINYLIDGAFEEDKRDITLWLRGSRNQNVYKLTKNKKFVKIDMKDGQIYEQE